LLLLSQTYTMPSRAILMQLTSRNDFGWLLTRTVRTGRRAGGLLAVREPVPLVRPLVRIEHHNAAVAHVGDEHFVRGRIVRYADGRLSVVWLSGPSIFPGVPIVSR
jgi:hypothetical protein